MIRVTEYFVGNSLLVVDQHKWVEIEITNLFDSDLNVMFWVGSSFPTFCTMLVDEFVFAVNYVFFLVVEWMAWTPMAYGLDTYGLDAYKNPVWMAHPEFSCHAFWMEEWLVICVTHQGVLFCGWYGLGSHRTCRRWFGRSMAWTPMAWTDFFIG